MSLYLTSDLMGNVIQAGLRNYETTRKGRSGSWLWKNKISIPVTWKNKSPEIPLQKKYQHMLLFIYRRAWLMGAIKKQAMASKDVGPAEIGRRARRGRGRVVLIRRAPAPRASSFARHYRRTRNPHPLPSPSTPARVRRTPPTPTPPASDRTTPLFNARNESWDFPI